MKRIKFIFLFITAISINALYAGDMILHKSEKNLKAYHTKMDNVGWDAELKGKIILISANYKNMSDVADKIKDKTTASIRLFNKIGIEIGDVLYSIDNNNLINGKISVTSIFYTKTLGYIMLGNGNLRLVNSGDRVVKRIIDHNTKNAFVSKGKGDYYREIGETGKAISFYKSALEVDKGNAEAHISLGYIYLNDDMFEYSYNEFNEAQKNIVRLYDNEDKYFLYKGLSEVRFKQAYYTKLPDELRNKYIDEGIKYSKQALDIYPDSKEVNYYLGIFYFKNEQPSDVMAKDQLLKAISLDNNNVDAFLGLAELYEKHNNKTKAASYAEQALKIDPVNDRAKSILKKFK